MVAGINGASNSKANKKKTRDYDVASGTLGTLHWADKVGNTPAWQNRMKKNKRGQRLYDFGQDLIERI